MSSMVTLQDSLAYKKQFFLGRQHLRKSLFQKSTAKRKDLRCSKLNRRSFLYNRKERYYLHLSALGTGRHLSFLGFNHFFDHIAADGTILL